MNTFLQSAQAVLHEANKPLHYKEITKLAIEKGLQTEGATPWATMNAQIAVDIKKGLAQKYTSFVKNWCGMMGKYGETIMDPCFRQEI